MALSRGIKNAKHPVYGMCKIQGIPGSETALLRPEANRIFLRTGQQSLGQQGRVGETGNQEEMKLNGQEKIRLGCGQGLR